MRSMPSRAQQNPMGTVLIEAFSESRNKFLEAVIPVDEYYSESHPVLDEYAYRHERNGEGRAGDSTKSWNRSVLWEEKPRMGAVEGHEAASH